MTKAPGKSTASKSQGNMTPPETRYSDTANPEYTNENEAQEDNINLIL